MIQKTFAALTAFAAALTLAAADAAAPQKSVYTEYQDWQFRPVLVQDENAGSNVRHQNDFTVPVHGPWLLNPSPDSITVSWITRVPCGAAIEYRKKGTEEFKRVWGLTYGQIDCSKDLHTFHLTGLEPATEYEYRLVSACDRYFSAYNDAYTGREIMSFSTLDPKKERYQAFVTADFHGGARLNLDPMIAGSGAENADLHFFLGDNVEDNMNDARFYITFGFLDDICRKWGKNKTTVFARGNHDIWGRETYQWGDYFARPDGKSYFAFAQGPVLYIVLDSMWTGGAKLFSEQWEAYRAEQAAWLGKLKKTALWKNAKFRIAMAHIGTHAHSAQNMMQVFKDVLNGDTDAERIHIFLCGHEHRYWRVNPRTDTTLVNPVFKNFKPFPANFNYTLVSLDLCEGMTIDVAPEKLVFKSHLWKKTEGGLRDAFEIYPDGSVKELMKQESFAVPPPPVKKPAPVKKQPAKTK